MIAESRLKNINVELDINNFQIYPGWVLAKYLVPKFKTGSNRKEIYCVIDDLIVAQKEVRYEYNSRTMFELFNNGT